MSLSQEKLYVGFGDDVGAGDSVGAVVGVFTLQRGTKPYTVVVNQRPDDPEP